MIIYRKKNKKRGTAGAVPRIPKARCPISNASTRSYRMLPVALRFCFGWGSPPILIGSDHRSAHILLPNSLPRYNHLFHEASLLHMYQHILRFDTSSFSSFTRTIPQYPTYYYMSTLNIKKFIKKHQCLRLGITRTIVLLVPRLAGSPGGRHLVVYPAPPWYNNPNNSSGYPEDQGDPEPKYDMCLGSPLPARHNPNNFSGSRPRRWAFPLLDGEKNGAGGRMTALAKRSRYSAACWL